jgi:hypothetical protein
MITSVHIADVGVRRALRTLLRPPRPGRVAGLVHADVGLAAPLGGSTRPSPDLRRIALVAHWDDEAALDRFEATSPLARTLSGGWRARLRPIRRFGSWPGIPDDLPTKRDTAYTGPSVVLTLGRVRLRRVRQFIRTSSVAEAAVGSAPGGVWATGFAKPPFVATCSLWDSTEALAAYAYGERDGPHPQAIAADRAEPFHRRSAFVRFEPLATSGSLGGRNPLAAGWPVALQPEPRLRPPATPAAVDGEEGAGVR